MNSVSTLRVSVIILGAILAGLMGLCGYLLLASTGADREIDRQRDALAQTRVSAALLAQAHADGRQLTDKVPRQLAPWTWSEQFPVMAAQIGALCDASNTRIDTLQPAPTVERGQVTRFPLRLTLHTDLAGLTRLLREIQRAVPVLGIDHLAIRVGQQAGDPLSVEITLSAYVLLDGHPAAGGR